MSNYKANNSDKVICKAFDIQTYTSKRGLVKSLNRRLVSDTPIMKHNSALVFPLAFRTRSSQLLSYFISHTVFRGTVL